MIFRQNILRRLEGLWINFNFLDYSNSSSLPFTITSTPTTGNLMVAAVGGIQDRDLSISGWTKESTPVSGRTVDFFYKFAGVGESTSFTVTLASGTIQGSVFYYEFSGVDSVSPVLYSPTGTTGSTSSTSLTLGDFNVTDPGIFIQAIAFDVVRTWRTNDSNFNFNQGSRRFQPAFRIYTQPSSTAQNVLWRGDVSNSPLIGMIGFRLL